MTNETKELIKKGKAYTVKEISGIINRKPQMIKRHYLKNGKLKGYQFGGERSRWVIYKKDLDEFIAKYMNRRRR